MWTKWTQHLSSEQEKKDFENKVYSSREVLERVTAILEERERALDYKEFDSSVFDSPSWPYLQASTVGRRSEIRDIKLLLTLDQQEKP